MNRHLKYYLQSVGASTTMYASSSASGFVEVSIDDMGGDYEHERRLIAARTVILQCLIKMKA